MSSPASSLAQGAKHLHFDMNFMNDLLVHRLETCRVISHEDKNYLISGIVILKYGCTPDLDVPDQGDIHLLSECQRSVP
jgi:hypothetical protein